MELFRRLVLKCIHPWRHEISLRRGRGIYVALCYVLVRRFGAYKMRLRQVNSANIFIVDLPSKELCRTA